jgi:hypothetical protein
MFEPSLPLKAIVIAVPRDIYYGADEPDLATGFWIDGARHFGERLQAFGDIESGALFLETAEITENYWRGRNDELDDWISDNFDVPDPDCPEVLSSGAWYPTHRALCAVDLSLPPDMPEEFQELRSKVLAHVEAIRGLLAENTSRISREGL